jgi:hypothetical protein
MVLQVLQKNDMVLHVVVRFLCFFGYLFPMLFFGQFCFLIFSRFSNFIHILKKIRFQICSDFHFFLDLKCFVFQILFKNFKFVQIFIFA